MTVETPGVLRPPPELHLLRAISPSQYSGLRSCALSGVWAANRARRPLPESPAARLGTVAHHLLEEAGRGLLGDPSPAAIERRWDELLAAAGQAMGDSWLDRHLAPLSGSVPDFEVRKLRATHLARLLAADPVGERVERHGPRHPSGHELAVSTPDGKAAGRIDAVLPGPEGPILRDYKSGAIYQEYTGGAVTLKESYSTQLKLYAAVFASMTGEWPARLEIVPLAGEPEVIPFNRDECVELLAEAIRLLDAVNAVVVAGEPLSSKSERLASPSAVNCRYCPYRPWCVPYQRAAGESPEGWPSDTWGEVQEVRSLGNGRKMLTLARGGQAVGVRGLDPRHERHPALALVRSGDPVAAFDLRRSGGPSSFEEGPMTVIYRLGEEARPSFGDTTSRTE